MNDWQVIAMWLLSCSDYCYRVGGVQIPALCIAAVLFTCNSILEFLSKYWNRNSRCMCVCFCTHTMTPSSLLVYFKEDTLLCDCISIPIELLCCRAEEKNWIGRTRKISAVGWKQLHWIRNVCECVYIFNRRLPAVSWHEHTDYAEQSHLDK